MTKNTFGILFICLIFFSGVILFFQNCGQKNNSNNSYHSPGTCRLHDIELTDSSLCARINSYTSRVCWQSGSFVHLESDGSINDILENLHICNFIGETSAAQITNLTVNNTNLYVSTSSSDNLPIALSVNSAAIDENGDLQLFSFASNSVSTQGASCTTRMPILYRVGLDEDGNVSLSDDSNVTCGTVTTNTDGEKQLSCQYAANQPGCTFTLTLWAYDSSNRFSQKQSIQVQMQTQTIN